MAHCVGVTEAEAMDNQETWIIHGWSHMMWEQGTDSGPLEEVLFIIEQSLQPL